MSGSTLLQFTPLSNQDKIAARTATCAWETLLDGTTTLSMYDTIEFFHEQVAPAIKDGGGEEMACAFYADFSIALLGGDHSFSTLLLLLIQVFGHRHSRMCSRTHRD